ncbi:hypothetical protein D4764_12G0010570 [Takifugu flavidus]|uniref:Uncharacterized protein n=1 Tax=Takifugu flavidus TaxID=433684 RepID=A0A5C6PGZ7_9TELE|nr:hypothetical protein D4764_0241970 [Takifugu flavidus]TWW77667.1 hypothetical protein D4764_12G0010570 [Takifugu flavidus]
MLQDGFLRVGGRLNRAAMPAETKHPVILSKHSRVAILILNPCDIEPLTPNHLLLMKTQPNMPPGIFNKDDLYARKRWRQERQK